MGFLAGAMGIANAQRTLNYVRTLAQFISQPEYKQVIPMFSILNEPDASLLSGKALVSWFASYYPPNVWGHGLIYVLLFLVKKKGILNLTN